MARTVRTRSNRMQENIQTDLKINSCGGGSSNCKQRGNILIDRNAPQSQKKYDKV